MKPGFKALQEDLNQEIVNILDYWKKNAVDLENGGFYGRRDHFNNLIPHSPKGLVLNARILFAFSAGYRKTRQAQYLQMAQRAFHYLTTYFIDTKSGGAFWSLDYRGNPLDTKKQIYGIAFCIYAFSEYHLAMESKEALVLAKTFFSLIEEYAFDKVNGGYHEAFTREWLPLTDLRLSEKDINTEKTMNTHLHVMEAYSNLYRIWPNNQLKEKIIHLIGIFQQHFISSQQHLHLFFSTDWQLKSDIISYGHDIESSWLIWEAVTLVFEKDNRAKYQETVLDIAKAARKGLSEDGSLLNESNQAKTKWNRERHWWQQAEAMVGFMNAWQLSGDDQYLNELYAVWNYIQTHLVDKTNGEWYWGEAENGAKMTNEDKLGFWKCPYHNVRMCIEVMARIDTIHQQ